MVLSLALADWKNFVEIYNENETKFIFFLSTKWVKITRLAIQQNPTNKNYQRIKKKITLFLIALVLIKWTFFLSCFGSFQCLDEKRKHYKTIIRHVLFDNFPSLTYPDYVSLIDSLIFMLKYSILVLEQDGWMSAWKIRKKILIRKVERIVAPTLHFFRSKHQ